MVNTGSRFWFGVVALGVVGSLVYLFSSGGELYGTLVLAFTAVAGVVLGITSIALRDGDVALAGAGAGPPAEQRPVSTRLAAAWPALAALGAGVCMIGLAIGGGLFYVGLAILGVTLVEWMVQSWAERSTADAEVNQRLRNRVMFPVEIPALALIGIAVAVLAFSRVLLAVSKTGSTVVAIVVATVILGIGVLLNARPKVSASFLAVIVVLGAAGLLGSGIVAAVVGEREFEAHESEGGASHGDVAGEGTTGQADEAPGDAESHGGG